MRVIVSLKEERREGKGEGVRYGDEAWGREPIGCWEKEKCTVHEDGECDTMSRLCENRVLKVPTQTAFVGHAAK